MYTLGVHAHSQSLQKDQLRVSLLKHPCGPQDTSEVFEGGVKREEKKSKNKWRRKFEGAYFLYPDTSSR